VDRDFGITTIFLTENELKSIGEAMLKNDDLTESLLGHGWMDGETSSHQATQFLLRFLARWACEIARTIKRLS